MAPNRGPAYQHITQDTYKQLLQFQKNWASLGPSARVKHYVRQSDYDRRHLNYVEEQREFASALAAAWDITDPDVISVYEDLNFKGSLPLEARASGKRLWHDIAHEGGPDRAPLVVTAYEIARLFRDPDPKEDAISAGEDFSNNARRFALHCKLYNTQVVVFYRVKFEWFDFNGPEGDKHLDLFAEYAREAGGELAINTRRLTTSRTRSSKKGNYTGGTARLGHYALPVNAPALITGGVFPKPEQLLYLPHALVVVKWWKLGLMEQMDNFPKMIRFAREQTARYISSNGSDGSDYRFHRFPKALHEYSVGSSALRRMACYIDKNGQCACAPSHPWPTDRVQHMVWRRPEVDENDQPYHEILPYEECVPIFPTTHMLPSLLVNPIYLGDRIQNEEPLTQHGLFRNLDRSISEEEEEEALRDLRDRASRIVHNGHHLHMRLVRGLDPRAGKENFEQAVREGRLNEVVDGPEALSPWATWRPDETDFWELCRKFCPIDMRLWRDSGYNHNALVLNRDCVASRGRPVMAAERTPYAGVWFCLRHGFTPEGAPNKRYPIYHSISRKKGAENPDYANRAVRCDGDRGRDGFSQSCSEWGGQDACVEVLSQYIQRHLSLLNSTPRGRELLLRQFAPISSPELVFEYQKSRDRLLERQEELTEEMDTLYSQKFELTLVKDVRRRAQQEKALLRLIATREEEDIHIRSEISRIEQLLSAPVRDDLISLMDSAMQKWKETAQQETLAMNSVARALIRWVGVLVENSTDTRETLLAVEWNHGVRDYILSWRNRTPHVHKWTRADDAWLRKNYTRIDAPLIEEMDKRFWRKGITMFMIARHCRELGLDRISTRGRRKKDIFNLHREWDERYQHFIDKRENSSILYAVLDRHPLQFPRRKLSANFYDLEGIRLGERALPQDMAARVRALVKRYAPDLP